MLSYQAPLQDIDFILDDFLKIESVLQELDGHEDLTRDDIQMVLTEAARFCEAEISPINQILDEKGCRLEDGQVSTPPELKQVWDAFVEAGWPGLICDIDDGGQGLPRLVYFGVQEFISSASIAFGDYAGLFSMAYILLRTHADEELKQRYLPGLADGSLAATMCMTEPHCGTDVGLIKTKAVARADGTYRLSGTKIFISGGDHDLTENIAHIVLARIPGAPAGPKGLSLFLVPKVLPDSNGDRNTVTPVGIEHKMGYKGSATCQMAFDDAVGWRIGEEGRGLSCIFVMVNLARLFVGAQGLCTAELAYQNAVSYARERLQGRALSGTRFPDQAADPLIVQPDVRRMLLSTRAFTEVARAIYLWLALEIDISQAHRDERRRQEAADRLALLTPVVKAIMSDFGFAACNDCMQIFGGHGYIHDNGMEQLVRDVKLAQIQEGANGILALDLIVRRVFGRQAQAYRSFVESIRTFITTHQDMTEFTVPLTGILDMLEQATAYLEKNGTENPEAYGAAGTEYQRLFGLTLFAWVWAQMAVIASEKIKDGDSSKLFESKLTTARFFMQRILPMAHGHMAVLKGGSGAMMAPTEDYF